MTKGKENSGWAWGNQFGDPKRIRALEEEAAHYREELRRHTEEVEALKKEKSRLQASVKAKEAIAAARRQ